LKNNMNRSRVLIGKTGLDGHDRGAKIVAKALQNEGMEVIYTGLRQTPEAIVKAAIQEDVHVIGLSILSGGHKSYLPEVADLLSQKDVKDILLIGGGIIPEKDVPFLKKRGVASVFGTGSKTKDIADFIKANVRLSGAAK